ncbi:hypothetical protein SAMN05216188_110256 [Lentzea xinjiangensis]|uniref:Uncharacterized protein n=1 Tax=Lentzea xinjiangensis TaxID=402600 RepID=A0A1H9NK31_9PSEU|nr:hypothetical protein [Lentzea xinjiangensis]SER36344.1 hypothetical protein SAMN05216188_110256 [Lentzea xinjiangensis]
MGGATAGDQLLILGEDSLDPRTAAAVASREFRGELRMSDRAAERVDGGAALRTGAVARTGDR